MARPISLSLVRVVCVFAVHGRVLVREEVSRAFRGVFDMFD
jgi:hypothetical protein